MAKIEKARFWTAVLYPENMRENWEQDIGDILQYPYAYCVHDLDKDSQSEHRKNHVHILIAFPNTTTYKHAMNVFDRLSSDGKAALNKIEAVIGIRNVYEYLIHNTEDCRRKGKYLYPATARITGNNFDIGSYEQLSTADKFKMSKELCDLIYEQNITNFADFYLYAINNLGEEYFELIQTNSGFYNRLINGNWQKMIQKAPENFYKAPEKPTEITCPECGSLAIIKRGKTQAGSQIWLCKDCGKKFVK